MSDGWMPNQPKRPHVTFRADAEKIARAREKAKRQGTNLSDVMRLKLDEYLYGDDWPFGE